MMLMNHPQEETDPMHATMTFVPVKPRPSGHVSPTPAQPQWRQRGDDPDADQIAAAQAGDLAAFNQLISRYQTLVFSIVRRMIREEHSADAVVQASFIQAYQTLKTFTGGSFQCWLLRIVNNRSIDHLRNQHRFIRERLATWVARRTLRAASVNDQANPQAPVEQMTPCEMLEAAINLIPPDLRMALLLRDVHGHSYEEVAAITAVSLDTVKLQLSHARAKVCAKVCAYLVTLPASVCSR
jgi:RNA polymerase sigma-70 factor (ECF subfamily)